MKGIYYVPSTREKRLINLENNLLSWNKRDWKGAIFPIIARMSCNVKRLYVGNLITVLHSHCVLLKK